MRKIIFFVITFLLLSFNLLFAKETDLSQKKGLEIRLYFSRHCGACMRLEHEYVPKILKKYGDKITFVQKEVSNKENLNELLEINPEGTVPTIVVAGKVFSGVEEIEKNLTPIIEDFIAGRLTPTQPPDSSVHKNEKKTLNEYFQHLSLPVIVSAGLIDGINPCAFAVIVFFISFLTAYNYSRRQIITIGTSYIFAVFLTYLLIGLGLFNALYKIQAIYVLHQILYAILAIACFILGILAIVDYLNWKEKKSSKEQILQLPVSIKKQINKIFGYLRHKEQASTFILFGISLLVGFLVSLLECACTGQVYLPVLSLILKEDGFNLRAFLYILIYNLFFITPLIVLFLLALIGVSSQRLSDFLKRNLGSIKLLMAFLFFALGIILLMH